MKVVGLLLATESQPETAGLPTATVSLLVWLGATAIVLVYVLWVRSRHVPVSSQGKPLEQLDLTNFVSLALSTVAVLSSLRLAYRAFTIQELQTVLGEEDLVPLVLGAAAVIWVSIKEIRKLLPDDWQPIPRKTAKSPQQSKNGN